MTDAQREIIALLEEIKAAAGGGGGAGVTEVSGTAPVASSGGATPAISIDPATPSDPGSMSAADKTKLDGLAAPSGGVIGTVGFVPASLPTLAYNTGIIASVAATGTGLYTVSFTGAQADTNYTPISTATKSGGTLIQADTKSVSDFTIQGIKPSDGSPQDPDFVEAIVTRLSQ